MSLFLSLRRRCSCRHWAMLALALVCVATPAWSAAPLAFDEAVRLAVARAPTLQARRSQTDAAREEAARAAALPDPKLTLGLTNVPVTGAEAFDLRADDMTMTQVGVMQEFPARAKRQARRTVADRTIEQAQALTLAEQATVRQSAAEAWILLWAAQREVETLQAQRAQSALAIRIAKARLAGGAGTAVETLATQSAMLELDNRIDAAEAEVAAARAMLARWLGVEPEGLVTEGSPPDFAVLPVDEATLLASVDRQGPLLAWRSRESVAEAEVTAAIAETRPDWSVSAMYGRRARTTAGMPRSDMLTVEFSVGLPLWTRDRQDRGIADHGLEVDHVAVDRQEVVVDRRIREDLPQLDDLHTRRLLQAPSTRPLPRDAESTADGHPVAQGLQHDVEVAGAPGGDRGGAHRHAVQLDVALDDLTLPGVTTQVGHSDAQPGHGQDSWSNTAGSSAGGWDSSSASSASSIRGAASLSRPAATDLAMRLSTFSKLASFWSQ